MQNPNVIRTTNRASTATRSRELSWSFILLVLVCACVVATGFFFAARQHFTSMDYGIKNSKLREQLRSLEAEKRRLMLAREIASSPLAIRKAALGLGLRNSAEVATAAIPVAAKASPERPAAAIPVQVRTAKPDHDSPRIVKTVLSLPSESGTAGATRSRVVDAKDAKKDKKEKTTVAALLKLK